MATFHCLSPGHLAVVAAAAFFLLASPALTLAQEKPPPWLLCGPYPSSGNYTANSTYQSNIHSLSLSLPTNTSSTPALFATGVAGAVPDAVYALALCRGDVANASACESCVAMAFVDAQARCPLVKDVLIFYDLCQLRFSNRDFFPDDDNVVTVYDLIGGSLAVGEPAAPFDAAVRRLANATADYAAKKNSSSSRRFATGEVSLSFDDRRSNNSKIYAVSQCTPEKTAEFCRSCLGSAIDQLPTLFSGRNGGGVFGTWCTFRYEVYPFFSGQPLLQLEASMVAAPAPAPALLATSSQDKSVNKTGAVLAILMPTFAALLATAVVCFWFWERKRRSAARSFRTLILIMVLDLVQVWEHWTRGNVVGLIDPSLSDHPPIEQVLKCLHIGLLCVQRNPAARPIMSWVNVVLNSSTVRLPSLSWAAFCMQEVTSSASSDAYQLAEWPGASECTDGSGSPVMSCNEVSITEFMPK
nr:unnamed protein product [Digitaria exilis]